MKSCRHRTLVLSNECSFDLRQVNLVSLESGDNFANRVRVESLPNLFGTVNKNIMTC